jgi:hypothetical protein
MASPSVVVSDAILEDKFIDLWQDYPCLYDIRSPDFKDRANREVATREIATIIEQSGKITISRVHYPE